MIITITPETITVFCLCIIASFMFGFVAGLSLEYHSSNKAREKQLKEEAVRLHELATIPFLVIDNETLPTTEEAQ